MPLTPEDVQKKQFSTVRFKEGYDEEEVDAFLDEVEAELRRLLAEHESIGRGGPAPPPPGGQGAPRRAAPAPPPPPAAAPRRAPRRGAQRGRAADLAPRAAHRRR